MEPLISIIVPVYNAEEYLGKCLDSILKQTYKNIQVICVDDESTDASAMILKNYEDKDKRILIVHKVNEGVSEARNAALKYADGEYILFVDSDDWIEQDTCQIAIECAYDNDADVVMWSYIREFSNSSRKKQIYNSDFVWQGDEVQKKLHRRMVGISGDELMHPENADALCTVWGKLYKRDIIFDNCIKFYDIREIGTYEDGLFNLDIFYYANKVIYLNQYLYHYRKTNQDSLTNRYNPNLGDQWNKLFKIMHEYIESRGLDSSYVQAFYNRISLSLIALGINECLKKCTARDKIYGLNKIITSRQYKKAITKLNIGKLPLHWKVFFTFAKKENTLGIYFLLMMIQKIRGR